MSLLLDCYYFNLSNFFQKDEFHAMIITSIVIYVSIIIQFEKLMENQQRTFGEILLKNRNLEVEVNVNSSTQPQNIKMLYKPTLITHLVQLASSRPSCPTSIAPIRFHPTRQSCLTSYRRSMDPASCCSSLNQTIGIKMFRSMVKVIDKF